jgi:hypothetical protein
MCGAGIAAAKAGFEGRDRRDRFRALLARHTAWIGCPCLVRRLAFTPHGLDHSVAREHELTLGNDSCGKDRAARSTGLVAPNRARRNSDAATVTKASRAGFSIEARAPAIQQPSPRPSEHRTGDPPASARLPPGFHLLIAARFVSPLAGEGSRWLEARTTSLRQACDAFVTRTRQPRDIPPRGGSTGALKPPCAPADSWHRRTAPAPRPGRAARPAAGRAACRVG